MASTHSYSPFSSAMATTHRNRADRFSYGPPLSLCRLRVAMSSCMAAHYTGNRPKMKDRVRTSIPLVGFRERGVFCALLDEPASDPVSRLALDGYERGGGDVCHQPTGGGVGRQRFATRLAGRRLDWRVCDARSEERRVGKECRSRWA